MLSSNIKDKIENSVLFIVKNFKSEIVLDDLAQHVGLSKYHFHRLFKQIKGITPLNYINNLKLDHAAHFLIMYPKSKQLEVAFESGYSSPAVFSRSFKQKYGLTPIEYRKSKLKSNQNKIKSNFNNFPLKISYLKSKRISVIQTNLIENNLNSNYKKLITKLNKPSYSIGFYIDAPMHFSLEKCKYFLGLDENNTSHKNYFDIEEGYYAYFNVQGEFDSVIKKIVAFKENIIDPSPYEIVSFIGFEKIKLPSSPSKFNYSEVKRTLYIKIKRK